MNSTRIFILLDRSGSMEQCKESTVSGLNQFIKSQKELPGKATLKLVQFDALPKSLIEPRTNYVTYNNHILSIDNLRYEVIVDGDIHNISPLKYSSFSPEGSTPLLDAQGKAIEELGEELRKLPNHLRPEKVLFVTITDGYENASTKFSADTIRQMISHQKEKYNWDFVYLGANQDAVATGATMGYSSGKSMTYNSQDAYTVGNTFTSLGAYAMKVRSSRNMNDVQNTTFSAEDRDNSVTVKQ